MAWNLMFQFDILMASLSHASKNKLTDPKHM